jgi:hypothetical protein
MLVLLVACGGASSNDLFTGAGSDAGAGSGGDASPSIDGSSAGDATTTDGTAPATDSGNDSGNGGSDGATDGGSTTDASDASDGSVIVDSGCGDTTASNANCGACGYKCVHNRNCVASRCAPAWQTISAVNQPAPRTAHAAVGFGGKFYTFGGGTSIAATSALDNGGIYDPVGDSWDITLPALKTGRCFHAAVANGTEIMTFGGLTNCADPTSTGPGLEEFDGNVWTGNNKGMPPAARYGVPNIWTGSVFFVYGGNDGAAALSSGSAYTPGTGWADVGCALVGCARGGSFSGFVDGNKVRIFGGASAITGGIQYDLTMKTWSAWTLPTGTPAAAKRTADDGRRFYVLTPSAATCPQSVVVKIYDKTSGTWSTDSQASPMNLNADAAAAWIGSELFAWSGDCGNGPSSVGGRYQPPAP